MSGSVNHLNFHEDVAVEDCVGRLQEAIGDQLVTLWLFGSKARGDFGPDSDIDLLAIIKTLDWDVWHIIRKITARCSLEYDVLLNTHILDQDRWEEEVRFRSTLWREIKKDGILLLPETIAAKE